MKESRKVFGICRVGEKGQIVIPKEARDMFGINPGDNLILLGDKKKGMALVKAEIFDDLASNILGGNND